MKHIATVCYITELVQIIILHFVFLYYMNLSPIVKFSGIYLFIIIII